MSAYLWWFLGLLALVVMAGKWRSKKREPATVTPQSAPDAAFVQDHPTTPTPVPISSPMRQDMPGDQLAAFYAVMSELQNTQLSAAQLADLSGPLIEALGDQRHAADILTAALEGTEWDWPAWYPYAKHEGYPTIQQVLSERDPSPHELLKQMLKPELHATAQAFAVTAKKSATKDDIISMLLQSGSPQIQPLLHELLTKHQAKQRHKIYRQVAEGVASRINRVAHGQYRYKQMIDMAQYSDFSHWLFVADAPQGNKPPKRCLDLHGTILPWNTVSTTFPRLPCKRLDCCCDIRIGTPEKLAKERDERCGQAA